VTGKWLVKRENRMRIVIIGGGAAGISSLRNLLNFNSNSTSQNPSTTTSCSISNDSSKDGLNDDINDRSNLGLKSQGNCSANEKDLGADLRFEEEEKKTKSEFQVVLYEKMESIGGVWYFISFHFIILLFCLKFD